MQMCLVLEGRFHIHPFMNVRTHFLWCRFNEITSPAQPPRILPSPRKSNHDYQIFGSHTDANRFAYGSQEHLAYVESHSAPNPRRYFIQRSEILLSMLLDGVELTKSRRQLTRRRTYYRALVKAITIIRSLEAIRTPIDLLMEVRSTLLM
jgi:hypothetical protein